MAIGDDVEGALAAYAGTPVAFRQATVGITDALAFAAPAPEEWSVAQVVTHLWIVDGHALVTLVGAERPPEPVMRPKNPPAFGPLLDAFAERRAAVVAAFRDLPADRWDTVTTFRTVERTPRQLLAGFVRHNATHLKQIVATRRMVERQD